MFVIPPRNSLVCNSIGQHHKGLEARISPACYEHVVNTFIGSKIKILVDPK